MSKCALCNRDEELKKSHILPKFAQRRIKAHAKASNGHVLHHHAGNERVVQNFLSESLLCADCEQRFSSWERVAADFLRKQEFEPPGVVSNTILPMAGLPYQPLKLFLLSLLWRMGVSKDHAFKVVNLGPHEDVLREMLLCNNPGTAGEYGCTIQILTDRTGRIPVTSGASRHRTDHACRAYRVIMDGFMFIWNVGSPEAIARFPAGKFLLKEDGTWDVIFQDRHRVPFVNEALKPLFHGRADGVGSSNVIGPEKRGA